MLLDLDSWRSLLKAVAATWEANIDRFNEIDSAFGDGDHGVTVSKIARVVVRSAGDPALTSISSLLNAIGTGTMAVGGGSAGPLYGMVFTGLAEAVEAEPVDATTLAAMLASARRSLESLTNARPGDKTLMDALIPATESGQAAVDQGVTAILAQAAQAASAGAEATKNMVAKFGRARSYGEQTLGTPDAGALSMALLFEGLYRGLTESAAS
ncbi:MAG: dihydroxyacetone kinase subunit L [Bifidobacteriaceae bacterium]|jgi:dihydroxyacetone kinase-like protein|nr:dihydroxyacetone kinase subunit L [Bifidobacteriaceae bacterium]